VQLTANVTIAGSAAVGARTVTVTNSDGQSGSLANGFTVIASAPAPTVTALNPASGSQGQSLAVTVSGSNFVSGATCSVGAGITVTSCAYGSASQLTANLVIAASAAVGPRTVTVTNPDGQSGSLAAAFTVSAVAGPVHLDFIYPNRTAVLSGGWDFLAKTAGGATRDPEQSGSLSISYDQTSHPGTIRIPLGVGELWQGLNNSQNMLFRNLPSDWTSLRLKIAAFNPVSDFQQVGLLAYQDDDNYVNVQRNYNSGEGGPVVGFFREAGGVTTRTDRRPLTNTGNLILRLDRNPTTQTYTGFYSLDNGATWVALTGAPTQTLTNPRLAIQVGANVAGTLPTADLAWVEILR
jgi:hypothetical protein